MEGQPSLKSIPDDELLRRLSDLTSQSRRIEADLIAHIGEFDARRLYTREATPSMFAYCTEMLHLSEAEAWLRILVARASREHPVLLTMLRDGRLHLSGIRRLAPHLTRANRQSLLKRATHKSRRQIEELVAELAPRPDVPARMRKLPAPRAAAPPAVSSPGSGATARGDEPVGPGSTPSSVDSLSTPGGAGAAPAPPLGPDPVSVVPVASDPRGERVEPLAPERYRVEFTASAELHAKLERLQALMRSAVPDGDLATLIDLAITEKIERLEAQRFGRVKAPRKSLAETDTTRASRHIPAPVRRAVHERDEGRCTYVDARGKRCAARERLEFHHRRPFARGGEHSLENLVLVCRAHNALLAELDYGKEKVARHRRWAGPFSAGTTGGTSAGRHAEDSEPRPIATARSPGP